MVSTEITRADQLIISLSSITNVRRWAYLISPKRDITPHVGIEMTLSAYARLPNHFTSWLVNCAIEMSAGALNLVSQEDPTGLTYAG